MLLRAHPLFHAGFLFFVSLLGFSHKKKIIRWGRKKKKSLDVSPQTCDPAQLTAENNLGLQASGWLTQTSLLLLLLPRGLGFGLMGS